MFKQPLRLLTSVNNLSAPLKNNLRSESTEVAKNRKWDLLSAVCLERHPVITKPMSDIEIRFKKMLSEIEFENSLKSDHEIRHELELKQLELQQKGLLDIDLDVAIKQSTDDIEDSGDAELAAFKFAPRVTEADKKNIQTSLERKLDKSLVLLIQQNVGDDEFWLPPQGIRADGETMRQAADRVLREACGDKLKARIYGNAPMGFYKYVYPKSVRESGRHGAKVFYYLARYLDGSVAENVKYRWLDRQELETTMPPQVHKSVSMFLVSDE